MPCVAWFSFCLELTLISAGTRMQRPYRASAPRGTARPGEYPRTCDTWRDVRVALSHGAPRRARPAPSRSDVGRDSRQRTSVPAWARCARPDARQDGPWRLAGLVTGGVAGGSVDRRKSAGGCGGSLGPTGGTGSGSTCSTAETGAGDVSGALARTIAIRSASERSAKLDATRHRRGVSSVRRGARAGAIRMVPVGPRSPGISRRTVPRGPRSRRTGGGASTGSGPASVSRSDRAGAATSRAPLSSSVAGPRSKSPSLNLPNPRSSAALATVFHRLVAVFARPRFSVGCSCVSNESLMTIPMRIASRRSTARGALALSVPVHGRCR